jgi:hypothetical protein
LPGSSLSERFDVSITPWLREPLQRVADSETRIITFVKPIQSGGSSVGEIALAWWGSYGRGIIQNNWPKDDRAKSRWAERILPVLEKCRTVKWTGERFDRISCQATFIGAVLKAQGVFIPDALDSDSVPYQVNEEIHSWKPGHLAKARGRQTAVWFSKALDISNAGTVGDQLEGEYKAGTQQIWEVRCPGCGKFHSMRTRWDDKEEDKGGLRYDSTGCKREDGSFDYNKLRGTIFYQMPCGFKVHDTPQERKALSISGRYSEPQNTGATGTHRSYNLEAVSVDYISWLKLIQEKHLALRALKHGDAEPWMRYITERECRFYSEDFRPYSGAIIINTALKKNRDGLKDRAARLWAADAQKGYRHKGELSHYWLVIRDVMDNGDSQLVYEGRVPTDLDLISLLDEHNCQRRCGVLDVTWDTKRLMEFCYRNGLNAVMGSPRQEWFMHEDKVRRFYSPQKAIHVELNVPPRFNYSVLGGTWTPNPDEPMLFHYNKAGLLSNLLFIRNHQSSVKASKPDAASWEYITHDVPGDVSEDYRLQNDAWERTGGLRGRSKEQIEEWRQTRAADHMMLCEAYIAMLMEMEGFIADRLTKLGDQKQ